MSNASLPNAASGCDPTTGTRLSRCHDVQHELRLLTSNDGLGPVAIEDHVRRCPVCRQYRRELLRSLASLTKARSSKESGTYSAADERSQWPSIRREIERGNPRNSHNGELSARQVLARSFAAAAACVLAIALFAPGTGGDGAGETVNAKMIDPVASEALIDVWRHRIREADQNERNPQEADDERNDVRED